MDSVTNEIKSSELLLQLIVEYREWSKKLWPVINRRRGYLIDRSLEPGSTMPYAERKELHMLQEYTDFYLDNFLPGTDGSPRQLEEETLEVMAEAEEYRKTEEEVPVESDSGLRSTVEHPIWISLASRHNKRKGPSWTHAFKHVVSSLVQDEEGPRSLDGTDAQPSRC